MGATRHRIAVSGVGCRCYSVIIGIPAAIDAPSEGVAANVVVQRFEQVPVVVSERPVRLVMPDETTLLQPGAVPSVSGSTSIDSAISVRVYA